MTKTPSVHRVAPFTSHITQPFTHLEDAMNRKLINLLSLGVIMLGASKLAAQQDEVIAPGDGETNYQTCMNYCMQEYGFAYCQSECKGLATQ